MKIFDGDMHSYIYGVHSFLSYRFFFFSFEKPFEINVFKLIKFFFIIRHFQFTYGIHKIFCGKLQQFASFLNENK